MNQRITIRLTEELRKYASNQPQLELFANNLNDLSNILKRDYPVLFPIIFLPSGELRPFLRLIHNGLLMTRPKVEFKDGDEIEFLAALAGG